MRVAVTSALARLVEIGPAFVTDQAADIMCAPLHARVECGAVADRPVVKADEPANPVMPVVMTIPRAVLPLIDPESVPADEPANEPAVGASYSPRWRCCSLMVASTLLPDQPAGKRMAVNAS